MNKINYTYSIECLGIGLFGSVIFQLDDPKSYAIFFFMRVLKFHANMTNGRIVWKVFQTNLKNIVGLD